MKTGEKIYELRKTARITQEEFADRLGVTHQAVSKWESGTAYPETETIIRIAELFGVSCDYLLKDDAPQETEPANKNQKHMLAMLLSFALAAVAAGYLLALVCFYAIPNSKSHLIGLGVFAGFLLVGFVLRTVGKYRFLNACGDAEKAYLAERLKAFVYAAVTAFCCYLPAVFYGNQYIEEYAAYGRLNFGSYLFSAIVFGFLGFSVAQTIETVRMRVSGETISQAQLADSVLHCFCTAAAAVLFALLLPSYEREVNDWKYLFLVLTLLLALALIAHAIVHKALEKTSAADFAAELVCALLLFPNGLCRYLLSIETDNAAIRVYAALSYTLGALLFAAAILQIAFAVRSKRKGNPHPLRALFFSLPVYATVGIILAVSYWGIPSSDSASNGILLLAMLAIYTAADALPRLFRKRGAKRA